MQRTDRLFEVIQILRSAEVPMPAAAIARRMEVSVRTVYRYIASLQAQRTPIEGAPGIGYVMRRGYDLPPVNFDVEEGEAVHIGLCLVQRTGDPALYAAALRAQRKLSDAAPRSPGLLASGWGPAAPGDADLARRARRM